MLWAIQITKLFVIFAQFLRTTLDALTDHSPTDRATLGRFGRSQSNMLPVQWKHLHALAYCSTTLVLLLLSTIYFSSTLVYSGDSRFVRSDAIVVVVVILNRN